MLIQANCRNGYFEVYRNCGCVSKIEQRKKDLLGYCEKHGTDRSEVHHMEDKQVRMARQKAGLTNGTLRLQETV